MANDVLSDSGCQIARDYGIVFEIPDRHHIALAHIDVDYTKRYEPTDAIAILLSLFVAA